MLKTPEMTEMSERRNTPGIIDTHVHYDDGQFDLDREALLAALPGRMLPSDRDVGDIEAVVNVGASLASCRRALELAECYERVYAAVGVHPDEVGELEELEQSGTGKKGIELLRTWAAKEKVVAIGEIGLDYYWDKADHKLQEKWFRAQLRLARELGLPVNIHSRDAAADTWRIMKEERLEEIGGIIHCYSYSWEMAEQYLDAGFYLGIGGVITFKNAKKLKAVVKRAPLEHLVLETDCPYPAPEPYRGKRNCSAYLTYVAEQIAEIKEIGVEEVVRQTTQNARSIYQKLRVSEVDA